jgi:uncharacterized membrane protein YkvA (DUF1232 family)
MLSNRERARLMMDQSERTLARLQARLSGRPLPSDAEWTQAIRDAEAAHKAWAHADAPPHSPGVADDDRLPPNAFERLLGQLHLARELVLDWRAGIYREVPWATITALSFAVLYFAAFPVQRLLRAVPGLGFVNHSFMLFLTLEGAQADLRRYARFKGYREDDYF